MKLCRTKFARLKNSYWFWAVALALATLFVLGFPALYFAAADRVTLSAVRLEQVERQDPKDMVYTTATPAQVLQMLANDQYTGVPDETPVDATDREEEARRCLQAFVAANASFDYSFGSYFDERFLKDWDAWQLDDSVTMMGAGAYDGAICTSTLREISLTNREDGSRLALRFDAQSLTLYSFFIADALWPVSQDMDFPRFLDELDIPLYLFLTQYLKLNPDNIQTDDFTGPPPAVVGEGDTEGNGSGLPKKSETDFTDSGMEFYGYFYEPGYFAYSSQFGPAGIFIDGNILQVNWTFW